MARWICIFRYYSHPIVICNTVESPSSKLIDAAPSSDTQRSDIENLKKNFFKQSNILYYVHTYLLLLLIFY